MKFSIIVPIFNSKKFVLECLESLEEALKRYSDVEVILIDDGSTKDVRRILAKYQSKYRVFFNLHKGLGATRNFGVTEATGDYILFLDADDLLGLNYFVELDRLITNESPDLIIFQWTYINEKSLEIGQPLVDATVFKMWPACWNKCYKKSLIENIEFPEGVLYEDVAYALEAYMDAKKIEFLNNSIYKYRVRGGSITSVNTSLESRKDVLEGYKRLIRRKKVPNFVNPLIVFETAKHLSKGLTTGFRISDAKHLKMFYNFYESNDLFGYSDANLIGNKQCMMLTLLRCKLYHLLLVGGMLHGSYTKMIGNLKNS